jgi:hypothetical protein
MTAALKVEMAERHLGAVPKEPVKYFFRMQGDRRFISYFIAGKYRCKSPFYCILQELCLVP